MEDAQDFHYITPDAIDGEVRQAGYEKFSGSGFAIDASSSREFHQCVQAFINGESHPAGDGRTTVLLDVIADLGEIAGRGVASSEFSLTGIPVIDQSADLIVLDELTAIGSGEAFFHFAQEPFVVVEHAFHGFDNQRFALATLFEGHTRKLFLKRRPPSPTQDARPRPLRHLLWPQLQSPGSPQTPLESTFTNHPRNY